MKSTLVSLLIVMAQHSYAASVFDGVTADQPVCYGREYSAEYLKSRPKQTVQKIMAKLIHDKEYEQNQLSVEITRTGSKNFYKTYRALLICDKDDRCYVECDGGSVNLSMRSDGRLAFKNNGFVIQGGCGGEGDEVEGEFLPATPGGDDQFRLTKLPSAFCQKSPVHY